MREHMGTRWIGIEDEAWFDDMIEYMEEHWNEIDEQPWFDDMIEYMDEHGYYNYRFRSYDDNYFGPGGYSRRGFGCMGW
jgi:hypothetical protein